MAGLVSFNGGGCGARMDIGKARLQTCTFRGTLLGDPDGKGVSGVNSIRIRQACVGIFISYIPAPYASPKTLIDVRIRSLEKCKQKK